MVGDTLSIYSCKAGPQNQGYKLVSFLHHKPLRKLLTLTVAICSTLGFLELVAGGDAPEYAAAAFDNVVDVCNVDLSDVEGACVPDVEVASTNDGSGAATLALTSASGVGALLLFLVRE